MKTWEDLVQEQLKNVKQLNQTQDGLNEQLAALVPVANKLGLYDAADYLTKLTETKR